jgi:cytochrome c biogenesis protein ResB
LTVREKGQEIAAKRIVVNEPLDIRRVRFYQASWGMTFDFRTVLLHVGGRDVELHPKEIVRIPGTPLSVRANQFLPSFDIDSDGHATTRDFEGKNPAVQIDFLEKEQVRAQVWLLKNQPETAFRILNGQVLPAAPPPFHLLDVDPILFSGIQVGYDPGAPLFWTGAIVLLIGLSMHFYMHQRRLRILVVPNGDRSDVTVGGWNSRTPEEFKTEFTAWTAELKRTIS